MSALQDVLRQAHDGRALGSGSGGQVKAATVATAESWHVVALKFLQVCVAPFVRPYPGWLSGKSTSIAHGAKAPRHAGIIL